MDKLGLVLGGGGAKGAYHIGVWQAMRELELIPDIVTGTSIGALNGALMVQDDYEKALVLWENIHYGSVFAGEPNPAIERINSRVELMGGITERLAGAVDISPFEELVGYHIDEERLLSSPIEFGFTTVQLPLMRAYELMRDDVPRHRFADYLLASASCFPVFPPRKIDGQFYVDGGYRDDIPIGLALLGGATEVIAVDLQSVGMQKALPETDVPITYIRSGWDTGPLFCFEPDMVRRNMRLGYLDLMKAWGKVEGRLYAFEPGELRRNYQWLRTFARSVHSRTGDDLGRFLPGMTEHPAPDLRPGVAPMGGLVRRFLDALEMAGRLFGMPPEPVYTAAEYNRELLSRVQTAGPSPVQRLISRLLEGEDEKHPDITGAVQRVLIILDILRRENRPAVELMYSYPLTAKSELAAAYYIYLLEDYYSRGDD